jgi:hypothetical protein
VDEYEHQFTLACTKMERSKMKLDRLQKVLISVQAGVEHLVDQLNSVKVVDHASNGQIPKENRVVTDETIVEALQESELTLIGVMNQIKLAQVTSSYNNNTMIDENKNSTLPSTTTTIMDMSTNLLVSKSPSTKDFDSMTNTTRPYNQRISLPLNQNDTIALEEENEEVPDGFALDDPEEALSRDRVKKASQQVLLAHEKKKKKIAISLPGSTGKGKQKIKKEQ